MAIISNLDNEDIDYEEDEKNDFVTFEELLKECGVSRDEL